MHSPKKETKIMNKDNLNHLNTRVIPPKRPNLSPKNAKYHFRNPTSTSPRRESHTPRKDKLTKTASKLFQRARSTDFGETYLVGTSTMFQRFTSTNILPSMRGKPRLGSAEPKEVHLGIEHVYQIGVSGAPSLSQIINQFEGDSKINLPCIAQNSDQMLEIHSKLESSQITISSPAK